MKKLYFLYNSHLNEYYFSNSSNFYKNGGRKTLNEGEIIGYLKLNIDSKRKSLLTLLNFNKGMERKVRNIFKSSKVNIENRINKL